MDDVTREPKTAEILREFHYIPNTKTLWEGGGRRGKMGS